jgi:hypothetical protein
MCDSTISVDNKLDGSTLGDTTHVSKKDNHVNKKNILIQLERMADGMAKQRNIDLNMLIPS